MMKPGSHSGYPNSLGSSSSSSPYSSVPVHPDVRFKRLPFYDVLAELLKPSSLGKLMFLPCPEH